MTARISFAETTQCSAAALHRSRERSSNPHSSGETVRYKLSYRSKLIDYQPCCRSNLDHNPTDAGAVHRAVTKYNCRHLTLTYTLDRKSTGKVRSFLSWNECLDDGKGNFVARNGKSLCLLSIQFPVTRMRATTKLCPTTRLRTIAKRFSNSPRPSGYSGCSGSSYSARLRRYQLEKTQDRNRWSVALPRVFQGAGGREVHD